MPSGIGASMCLGASPSSLAAHIHDPRFKDACPRDVKGMRQRCVSRGLIPANRGIQFLILNSAFKIRRAAAYVSPRRLNEVVITMTCTQPIHLHSFSVSEEKEPRWPFASDDGSAVDTRLRLTFGDRFRRRQKSRRPNGRLGTPHYKVDHQRNKESSALFLDLCTRILSLCLASKSSLKAGRESKHASGLLDTPSLPDQNPPYARSKKGSRRHPSSSSSWVPRILLSRPHFRSAERTVLLCCSVLRCLTQT